jgi:hypothetical protein
MAKKSRTKASTRRTFKYMVKAAVVSRQETAQGTRLTTGDSRPPYICVHGPYGGCLRYEYNATLDIYGPESSQVDCGTCKYF